MANLSTTIDYCEGVHSTGNRMRTLRTITTEPIANYHDCPQEEQDAVLAAAHLLEVVKLEKASLINARVIISDPTDGLEAVNQVLKDEGFEDRLFDAGREDAETFVREHIAAVDLLYYVFSA